jgi:crotonobetainyl-CoA:carnitine CoA-transferase CaiB-like acyl-CoA transferase
MPSSLTDAIRAAVAAPARDASGFDVHAALADVLAGIGERPEDCGGEIRFRGADPIVPSTLRLGAAAGIALVAKSVAIAKLARMRGVPGQDIAMDLRRAPHRLCPFYDRKWELLNGFPGGAPANASPAFGFRFYRTADDRYVMPLNLYPKLRIAAQKLLGVPDDTEAVSAAIARWNARELEAAGNDAGVVMPMLRSPEELFAEPHYREALADMPLITIERIRDSAPEPFAAADEPLAGVRALGMGHVIAGAGVGRALALHGADVLNLWRPDELEHDATYMTANVGMRSATLDPYGAAGQERLRALLADADVFFANRRPGYLEKIGLSPAEAAALRPGIVHATASLHGETGPWAGHVGFDQSAGSLVGMMNFEGGGPPALPPILVVNDYIVSWLITAGIVEALARRAEVGGSYRVHVSLTRAALWILSLGIFDRAFAHATAGGVDGNEEHRYLDPELFTAQTPMGFYQGVTDQVQMSGTPGGYGFTLLPRGSSMPEWL